MRQQEAGIIDPGQQAAYAPLVWRLDEPVGCRLQRFLNFAGTHWKDLQQW
jgi:hypothetical protein